MSNIDQNKNDNKIEDINNIEPLTNSDNTAHLRKKRKRPPLQPRRQRLKKLEDYILLGEEDQEEEEIEPNTDNIIGNIILLILNINKYISIKLIISRYGR
jgi:hypothetical protein